MKKMYAVILTLCVGLFIAGVNCGSETTEIAWVNGTAGEGISDIVWFDGNNQTPNQTWNETLDAAKSKTETTSKEITSVNGYALCSSTLSGTEARIYVDLDGDGIPSDISWRVDEGSSNRYTISKTE